MSIRAKAINTLYRRNKITLAGLKQAVKDGVITTEEYKIISGEDY